ncbi:restriction endonuclease [Pseudofrankia sp. DC12]|uniref:restriction endonuclease n=1 Tax=Pseudofrankia sp. DC12 TaxID=683315 RepID=UPI000A04E49E|nr:restriction endonuclease [Pseudofrankia sp. DC12]
MEGWQDFERLAEQIYSELAPDAVVKWNDRIYGHESETKRQIDVSVRWADNDDSYLLIVQAKDWSTPADVTAVGEFASVVRDVRASRGIMVCRSGFTETAKTYARNVGISLHNLHDARSRKWRHELTVPILWVDLLPRARIAMRVWFGEGDQIWTPGGFIPLSRVGENTPIDILETFEDHWNGGRASRELDVPHAIRSTEPLEALVLDKHGEQVRRPVFDFCVLYKVTRRAWLGQFEPHSCRGLINYHDSNSFLASHLPIGEIPTQRDGSWAEIEDPDKVAPTLRGTFVTTEAYTLERGSSQFEYFDFGLLKACGSPHEA